MLCLEKQVTSTGTWLQGARVERLTRKKVNWRRGSLGHCSERREAEDLDFLSPRVFCADAPVKVLTGFLYFPENLQCCSCLHV